MEKEIINIDIDEIKEIEENEMKALCECYNSIKKLPKKNKLWVLDSLERKIKKETLKDEVPF